MGRVIVPMLPEKGVRVVGAINRSSDIGRDVGELCGLGRPLGVTVSDRPEDVLAEVRADIAILCVATYLDEMLEHVALCARHGLDVLTTAEELLFPWRTAPVTSAALERLALDHSVTIVGSGYQDYYWVNQVGRMAGTCHRIDRVVATSRYNVDDYGPVLATDHRVGLTVAEFNAALRDGTPRPSYMQVTADAVAADLDLRIESLQEHVVPTTSDEPLRCEALGVDVAPGTVTGTRWRVEVETSEGVSMLFELDGRLYDPGEVDLNRWTLEGEPTAVVENPNPDTGVDRSMGSARAARRRTRAHHRTLGWQVALRADARRAPIPRFADERSLAGEHLEHHAAKRVDVGPAIHALTLDLLASTSSRVPITEPGDLVFPGPTGGFLDGSALRARFYLALKAARLGHLREGEDPIIWHDLRHTFGTLGAAVWPLHDLQAFMGHANIQTTMIYVHHLPKTTAAAALSAAVSAATTVGTENWSRNGRSHSRSAARARVEGRAPCHRSASAAPRGSRAPSPCRLRPGSGGRRSRG